MVNDTERCSNVKVTISLLDIFHSDGIFIRVQVPTAIDSDEEEEVLESEEEQGDENEDKLED